MRNLTGLTDVQIQQDIANCGLLLLHDCNSGICIVDNIQWRALSGSDQHSVWQALQASQDVNDSAHTNPDIGIMVVPKDRDDIPMVTTGKYPVLEGLLNWCVNLELIGKLKIYNTLAEQGCVVATNEEPGIYTAANAQWLRDGQVNAVFKAVGVYAFDEQAWFKMEPIEREFIRGVIQYRQIEYTPGGMQGPVKIVPALITGGP